VQAKNGMVQSLLARIFLNFENSFWSELKKTSSSFFTICPLSLVSYLPFCYLKLMNKRSPRERSQHISLKAQKVTTNYMPQLTKSKKSPVLRVRLFNGINLKSKTYDIIIGLIGMSDANYRIRYKKGDFEVEVQGDKAWVEGKFEELQKGPPPKAPDPSPSGSQAPSPPTGGTTLPGSLMEFVLAKGNPTKHTDRAVLFAYWLFKKENMCSFNSTDISDCYDQTRIVKPQNIPDIVNQIQGQGLVTPVKEEKEGKKAWVITTTGEKYIDQMKA
jgi:hypothetical protein